jgi:hypothetical protein
MVVASHPAEPAKRVLIEPTRLFELAQPSQGGGEVVGRPERLGMIAAQGAAESAQGVLEEFTGPFALAQDV